MEAGSPAALLRLHRHVRKHRDLRRELRHGRFCLDDVQRRSTRVRFLLSLGQPAPLISAPQRRPSKNFTSAFVIDLERERKRQQSRQLRVRIARLLDQAVEFQRLLDSGEVRFRADLARRTGLSAMRITQILALLRLAPPILDYIRALPPGTAERSVTERALRSFTHTDRASQLHRAAQLLPAFARFARRTGS